MGTVGAGERIFEQIRVREGQSELDSFSSGELTPEIWERVARGSLYAADQGETHVFAEHAIVESRDDVTTHYQYFIERFEHTPIFIENPAQKPIQIEDGLMDLAGQSETIRLLVSVRGMSRYRRPGMPPVEISTVQQQDLARQINQNYLEMRIYELGDKSSLLKRYIIDSGGLIRGEDVVGGGLFVEVPTFLLRDMISRDDIIKISIDHLGKPTCNTACTQVNTDKWRVGVGRIAERLDIQRFHTANFDGERTNHDRHSYGDLTRWMCRLRIWNCCSSTE